MEVVEIQEPDHYDKYAYASQKAKAGDRGILLPPVKSYPNRRNFLGESGRYIALLNSSKFLAVEDQKEQQKIKEMVRTNLVSVPALSGHQAGTDPELFVVGGGGGVLPAWTFLPSKSKPIVMKDWNCAAFWDGFQAEFTTPPMSCHAHLVDRIQAGLCLIWGEAKKKDPKASFSWECLAEVDEDVMLETAPEHAALGCEPSLNAYGEKKHLEGLQPTRLPLRFAGCHYHYSMQDKDRTVECIKMMDQIAGIASVCVLKGMEDIRRREFYGLAGEYRIPKHGIEWRVLSSATLASPVVTHLLFDLARAAASLAEYGMDFLWERVSDEECQRIINTLDHEAALKCLQSNKNFLFKMLGWLYGEAGSKKAWTLIEKGAKVALDVSDMTANWYLKGGWAGHSGNTNCCIYNSKLKV